MTSQIHVIRKTPCNGCRERKRKCSYEQPCARCVKSGVECVYTVMPSPKDLEYMQELEYINQVESIQSQITAMEREIAELRLKQQPQATLVHDYPSPVSLAKSEDFEIYPLKSLESVFNKPAPFNRKTILESKQYQAEISKPHDLQPWILTVKNGQMVIDTQIKSHAQLLSCIGNMVNTAIYQNNTNQVPFPLCTPPGAATDDMATVMGIMIWKKYGKTRYKTYTKYTPRLLHHYGVDGISPIVPVDGLTAITFRLISTFLQCPHYSQLAIYRPAFTRLFLQGDILQSAAALAFTCIVCCQFCKHLIEILPLDALPEYALYYFEQARDLIADKFDVADLETMITFTCLGIYKLKQTEPTEGGGYIEMAERIYDTLKPQYEHDTQSDEGVLYHRFHRYLYHAHSVFELHKCMREANRPQMSPQKLSELLDDSHIPFIMGPGDSEKEKQFILMRQHVAQLRRVIKEGGKLAFAPDYPTYISIFSHHVEMGLRHWYANMLPPQFRLSLPLFEDSKDDLSFFTVLERECGDSPVAVLATMYAYTEYTMVAKSYIPKEPKETKLETEDLIKKFREIQAGIHSNDKELDSKSHHWMKLVEKMRLFRQQNAPDNDETDEAYFTRFIRALDPSNLRFDMPVTHTAVKASLNMVRLSQFMMSKDFSCLFDARWLLNAWDILIRAAKFKYQPVDRIRANLIVCLDVVKKFSAYSSRLPNPPLLSDMQKEFNDLDL